MSEGSGFTRSDLETTLVKKAWEDPAFRERLMQNPKAVVQEEMAAQQEGFRLPDNMQVQVLEETGNVFYIVLPRAPSGVELGELSDDELEAAAGGVMAASSSVGSVSW